MSQTKAELINAKGGADLGGLNIDGSAPDNSVNLDSSGRLLVGTSSARSNFFNTSAYTPRLQLEGTGTAGQAMFSIVSGDTIFGPYLNFARQKSGSIGGNTAVSSNDVLGNITFQGSDGAEFVVGADIVAEVDGTPGANDMPGRLLFRTTADGASSPTQSMIIYNNGEVQIARTTAGIWVGTTSDGAYRIGRSSYAVSSGTLYIGNAAIQVSSDVRLKENIEDTNLDALDAVNRIKVKDFTWNDPTDTSVNNRNARGKWTGLIAQELVEILPFVVNAPRKEEDGSIDYESESIWTLDQSQLCPVLIKAVQQQQEIIAMLEARVAALETP